MSLARVLPGVERLKLKVSPVVGNNFVVIVRYVVRQSVIELLPAIALEDLGGPFPAFDHANRQHLRTCTIHGIQDFAGLDAKLHQFGRKFPHNEFREFLLAAFSDVPLHD